jgi:peptide subunit release factor 1 (eRF1)
MAQTGAEHLVIASHRELISRFEAMLPMTLREKIVGSYPMRTDQGLSLVKEMSQEAIDDFERRQEEVFIGKLAEGSSKKDKGAVLGLDEVLSEMAKFRVHVLIIGKEFLDMAHRKPDEARAGLGLAGYASDSKNVVHPGDLVDELIESAVRWRIRIVNFTHEHEQFDASGIGAILK